MRDENDTAVAINQLEVVFRLLLKVSETINDSN